MRKKILILAPRIEPDVYPTKVIMHKLELSHYLNL